MNVQPFLFGNFDFFKKSNFTLDVLVYMAICNSYHLPINVYRHAMNDFSFLA